eukprot:TCONS_00022758-protein
MRDTFHLPQIPTASCYLITNKTNNNNSYNRNIRQDNRCNASTNPNKTTSLYALHCFFKLASQELSPSFRKQAIVKKKVPSNLKSKKNTENQQNRKNKKVVFPDLVNKKENAKRKITCVNKIKEPSKRKGRSISMSGNPPTIQEDSSGNRQVTEKKQRKRKTTLS